MNIKLISVFVGHLIVTSYRSVPAQTKPDHCHWTSIGDRCCHDGVAVSQDLLLNGKVKYGDWIYIEGIGLKRINDCMNARWRDRLDVWVASYDDEKAFDKAFRGKKLKVWVIKLRLEE